ncbi:MAG: MFS transporter [Candidatus Nezhaarchaeota archaeon]|nr:MFS transporter [Candidatus Nezhaarchaeota archaeon]MCX8141211.1 MFS transporter [Candidatus Nezhaarchaeota archaeon]MDW8049477.1 MFS transporter [Nitrososphaerota archaeon]
MNNSVEVFIMSFIAFATLFDSAFMIPIMALYAMELGANEILAGLILGLFSITIIPASLLSGILVDRFGKRRILTLGLLLDAFLVFMYGYVTNYNELIIIRVLHAIGSSLTPPAFIARVREMSGDGRLGFSLGRFLAPMSLSIALGSMSAGVLTATLGYRLSFTIASIALFVAFVLSVRLPETVERREWRGLRGLIEAMKEKGLKLIAGLWLTFFLYIVMGLIGGGLAASLVKYGIVMEMKEARLIAGIGTGLASFVATAFYIINGLLADRRGLRFVVLFSAATSICGFTLAAATLKPITIILGLGLFGVGIAGIFLVSTILVTAPVRARGTAAGLQQVLMALGIGLGAPLGGFLSVVGPTSLFMGASIAVLLAASAIKLYKLEIR